MSDLKRLGKKVGRLLIRHGVSYQQSKRVIKYAREHAGLKRSKKRTGSIERLTSEEAGAFVAQAYDRSGKRGLMMRTLLETGTRVAAFTRIRVEDIAFTDLEIRIVGKGEKARDVPILRSLAQELRLHIGERRTGYLFPSPRGRHYSKRRIQQIVKATAEDAGITKRVYPHLLRHTMAQRLADAGMQPDLLQRFLGHTRPETTQVYYEPNRSRVKRSFERAMRKNENHSSSKS